MDSTLEKLIDQMTDAQFWEWVGTWLDPGEIIDIVKNWEDDTQRREIPVIRRILAKKRIKLKRNFQFRFGIMLI